MNLHRVTREGQLGLRRAMHLALDAMLDRLTFSGEGYSHQDMGWWHTAGKPAEGDAEEVPESLTIEIYQGTPT